MSKLRSFKSLVLLQSLHIFFYNLRLLYLISTIKPIRKYCLRGKKLVPLLLTKITRNGGYKWTLSRLIGLVYGTL